MDAAEFARKWTASKRTERAASQEHFLDICRMLGEPTPNKADPSGDFYAFEKGASRASAGDGFADVWLRGHFGWEYKGKRANLREAYLQLLDYHEALEQPPLLVVCDLERFEVHTKWTGFESWTYEFDINSLASDEPVRVTALDGERPRGAHSLTALQALKALWEAPERLRPVRTTDQITREAAELFEGVVAELRRWGNGNADGMRIGRFVSRAVFCMFASDTGLLPRGAFSELLSAQAENAGEFRAALAELFRVMEQGGRFGAATIPWINGDLFTDDDVPDDLTTAEILTLRELDKLNWSDVEPAIFGTLFERVLDPGVRAELGAHYTSRADIETLVEPVLMAPLRREWRAAREAAEEARALAELRGATEETQRERIHERVAPFLDRLTQVTVLDPACGSGNFLYVSLALLKSLEKEAIGWAGLRGVSFRPRVHPSQLLGIEKNPYAHELASIVVWIGYLQWKQRNAIALDDEEPILQKLNQIRLMDAIVDLSHPDGPREPEWPAAAVIVGNPPFLGRAKLRRELGGDYVDAMYEVWEDRVQRSADLCCYWHEKARRMVHAGRVRRAGLLATQAIRGPASRETLARIKESGDIFFAESNREWVLDGAAVRISMVGFDDGTETDHVLDGQPVAGINVNLTSGLPLTEAVALAENKGLSFQGGIKVGPFEIAEDIARQMLASPNPDGRDNADVVRPWMNGDDLTGRPKNLWVIDFPPGAPLAEAELYEAPFEYVAEHVRPGRQTNSVKSRRERWWTHGVPALAMRQALTPLDRYLATTSVAKYRLFRWVDGEVLADRRLIVFARDDDYFFGVLHSRVHELWALNLGARHGDGGNGTDGGRPTYNNTTCFLTFPLPWAPGSEPEGSALVEAVGAAARRLDELREGWLNPEGPLVGEEELRRRTLTNLYNERPAWLNTAHRNLDEAVFNAYGWPPDLSDDEVLARLLALNLDRARAEREQR